MTTDKLKIALQYALPKRLITRLMGKFAAAEAGIFTQAFMKWFIRHYGIDMSEAVRENPRDYRTFNDFFTRYLKPELRPLLATEPQQFALPVDGAISQFGDIVEGQIFQAKGHSYGLTALVGGDERDAAAFKEGSFATIYLAPKDYHRIHMPCSGVLRKMIYVPGDLFSVNPLTAQNVPNLFARNERVVAIFDGEFGKFAMVLVGATIVASIGTVWSGTVTPPGGPRVHQWNYPASGQQAIRLQKGEEMGHFKLGSTVVLLFPEDVLDFDDAITPEAVTRMGGVMGTLNQAQQ